MWPDGEIIFHIFCHFIQWKCPMATQNSQSRLKNWPNTKLKLEFFSNTYWISPKWWNFAKSGHTGSNADTFLDDVIESWYVRFEMSSNNKNTPNGQHSSCTYLTINFALLQRISWPCIDLTPAAMTRIGFRTNVCAVTSDLGTGVSCTV